MSFLGVIKEKLLGKKENMETEVKTLWKKF